MKAGEILQRFWRKAELLLPDPREMLRRKIWQLRGASIGAGTRLPPCRAVWPHQVRIGRDCVLQPGIFFNYDHYWTPGPSIILGDRVFVGTGVEFNIQGRLEIGDDTLIASGCCFIDHDHGRAEGEVHRHQPNTIAPIMIGRDVWIGARCVVLKGVQIGDRAVLGAGSVLTQSLPEGEVWAGVPARKLPGGGS